MSAPASVSTADARDLAGTGYALGAFGLWGAFPLYFKAVAGIPAPEVLAHRVIWSALCVALLLCVVRQWPAVRRAFADRRTRWALAASSLVIAFNWLIFIWAIAHDRVLESSLGYYIAPLVSILFGWLVFRERLRRLQWAAVVLAAVGVGYMLLRLGALPWVSLALAVTFAGYGLIRKLVAVPAIPGLFVETLMLGPLALGYLLAVGSDGVFGYAGAGPSLLLAAAGVVTAVPLIFYTQAVRRLRMASVGLFQYITPTGHMLLAVFVFGERFTSAHVVTFACIWLALALYSISAWRGREAPPVVRDA